MKGLRRVALFVVCLAAALSGPALAATCSPTLFIQAAEYPTGGNAAAVATGDFNGDGVPDVAVTRGNNQDVAVLLNNGDGTFGPPIVTDTNSSGNYALAAADLRGNGVTDLIVTSYNAIGVFLGHGDGTFDAPVFYDAGVYNLSALVVGKFDGNDTWDVAVGSFYANPIVVFPGNGNGTLGTPVPTEAAVSVSSLAIGHFHPGANLDLVASPGGGGSVAVFPGNGDGTFGNPAGFIAGSNLDGVAVADFNLDTHDDIAIVSGTSVSVLLGNGAGGFQAALQYPTGILGGGLVVADFNQDTYLDLAVSGQSDFYGGAQEISVLYGGPEGAFAPGAPYFAGRTGSIAQADFNGDSLPDLATAGDGGSSVFVLLDTTSGALLAVPDSRVAAGPANPNFATGDWNDDGKSDFAWGYGNEVAVYQAADAGRYTKVAELIPGDNNNVYGVATGDFDEDGREDLVASTYSTLVLFRRGELGFDAPVTIYSNSFQLQAVEAGDFNADGHEDIALGQGCCGNGSLLVFLGNGDGTFQAPVQTPLPVDVQEIVAGVSDGGPGQDVAVVGSGGVWFLLSNGNGSFHLAPAPVMTPGITPSVAFGPFFGTALDLLVSDGSGHISLYPALGPGSYGSPVLIALPSTGGSVAAGDYDGDGLADFAVLTSDGQLLVFLGLGNGHFQTPLQLRASTSGYLATADIVGNGIDHLAVLAQSAIESFLSSRLAARIVQPAPQLVGISMTLTVNASGYTNLTYQWRKDGVDLVDDFVHYYGTKTATLHIQEPGFDAAGSYDVVVTDSCTSVDSNSVSLQFEFADVPPESPFYGDVIKIAEAGITSGCSSINFCPTSPVSRAQMAVFLLKSEHGSAYTPPACSGIFADVACPSQFADWIEQLAAEGVTTGCGGGNFCPDDSVTRAQMAVFLLKTSQGSSYTPPPATGIFGDVPVGAFAADFIEDLYNRSITGGCQLSPLLYCPGNVVLRQQMATFLVRTFGL